VGGEQAQRRLATQDLKTNRKKGKTIRNQQNREKAGKEPKSSKTAAGRELDLCRLNATKEGVLEA
jgi:hypothetical protein